MLSLYSSMVSNDSHKAGTDGSILVWRFVITTKQACGSVPVNELGRRACNTKWYAYTCVNAWDQVSLR